MACFGLYVMLIVETSAKMQKRQEKVILNFNIQILPL